MSPDVFIYTTKGGFHSLIDGRSFPAGKARGAALQGCRDHVEAILQSQDGDKPIQRTLAERRNLYQAMATP